MKSIRDGGQAKAHWLMAICSLSVYYSVVPITESGEVVFLCFRLESCGTGPGLPPKRFLSESLHVLVLQTASQRLSAGGPSIPSKMNAESARSSASTIFYVCTSISLLPSRLLCRQ